MGSIRDVVLGPLPDGADLAAMWGMRDDTHIREQLILHYLPMIEPIAIGIGRDLSAQAELDDLIGFGTIGLIEAIERFDPTRNRFEPYANSRIRGAIRDGVAGGTGTSKKRRRRARILITTENELHVHLGRRPTDTEIAERLSHDPYTGEPIDAGWVARVRLGARDATVTLVADMAEEALPEAQTAEFPVDVDELRVDLAEAITALPPRERVVFILYYFEELNLDVIAQLLSVSKPLISSIRDEAVLALRAHLTHR